MTIATGTPRVLPLGVLVSGSGSNLQAILDAIARRELRAEVRIVVSNKPDVFALTRAERAGIPTCVVDSKRYQHREAFDAAVVETLSRHAVEVVMLAGFMRIVTPVLLGAFPWRVVNVHPALCPSFPGTHSPRQALQYGVCVAGCTVHLVDAGVDTGPILAQAVVPVLQGDDEATLQARIQAEEHRLVPFVLQWFADDLVRVDASGEKPRAIVSTSKRVFGLSELY